MQGGLKGLTGVLITHTHGRYDPVFLNHFTHTHTQSTYIRSMNRAHEEYCEQIIQNSVTKPYKQTNTLYPPLLHIDETTPFVWDSTNVK